MPVYFVQAEGLGCIKIGFTDGRVADRLRSLQTACPARLKTLGVMQGTASTERGLHRRFAHLRISGEWFRAEKELLDHIAALPPEPEPKERQPKPPVPSVPPDGETFQFVEMFADPITGYVWEIWIEERQMAARMPQACWMSRKWTEEELKRVSDRVDDFLWHWGVGGWIRPTIRLEKTQKAGVTEKATGVE